MSSGCPMRRSGVPASIAFSKSLPDVRAQVTWIQKRRADVAKLRAQKKAVEKPSKTDSRKTLPQLVVKR